MRIPLILIASFYLLIINSLNSQCSIENPLAIPDLSPVSANLIIDGVINNDLSTSQGVCGITLEFDHQQIGDLTIEITSPGGESVTLIGPTGSFGNTSFTDWSVTFIPCSESAAPDAGFLNKWNNNQSWGILGDYTGTYFPYLGCLEDFNSGSVNGIWSIQVLDNTQFDIGTLKNATIFFCEPAGLTCNVCEAYAGEFEVDNVNVCLADPSNISLNPIFPNGQPSVEYQYYYVISQGNTIHEISQTLDMTGYDEGSYNVCGLSISESDVSSISALENGTISELTDAISGMNPSICGDLTNNCVNLVLAQSPTIVDLDIIICDSDEYTIGNETFSSPGEYEVIVDQPNGCDSIYNLTLSTSANQALVTANSTVLDCNMAELELRGENSQVENNTEIIWSTSNGGFSGPTNEINTFVNQAGTYVLTLKKGNCISTSSITIMEDEDAPEITLSGGSITCSNQSVQINFSSTESINSYSWTGPNGFTSNEEDPIVTIPGDYTVMVESDNGCMSSKSVTINQAGDLPVLQLSAAAITCNQPQVTINVSASSNNLTYEWSGPNGFTFNGKNPIVGEAGTYFVSATDPFGCVGFESIIITGNAESIIYDFDFGIIECPGGRAFLEANVDDENAYIKWILPNNSEIEGSSVNTSRPGIHILEIISNGCMSLDTFTVIEDYSGLPTAMPFQSNIIDCSNQSTTLHTNITSNIENVDYITWNVKGEEINDSIVMVDVSGSYTTFIYTNSGCAIEYTHSLQYDTEVPDANISEFDSTCINDNQRIVATANENLDYEWSGPNGFSSQDSLIEFLDNGTYLLTITDSKGCQKLFSERVNVDTIKYNMNAFATDILNCLNDTVYLSLARSAVGSVEWMDNSILLSNNKTVPVDEPGIYTVSAIGSRNGCATFDTVEVFQDIVIPDVEAEDQAFQCGQMSLVLNATSITPNVIFDWTGPNGFTSNTQNPLVDEEGTYELTVTALNGCTNSVSVDITQDNELPDVDASSSNDLDCINTTSILTGTSATSGVSFQWKGPLNIFDEPVINIQSPGDYQFIVTGQNGCSDSVTVNVPFTGSYPEFSALGDTLFCGENNSFIDVQEITTGVSYEWTGPNGFTSNDLLNQVLDPGMYILTGTGTNSCVSVDTTFYVIDNEPANLMVVEGLDTLDCIVTDLSLDIESDRQLNNIMWTGPNGFSSSDLDINISNGGNYILEIIAENNCETTLNLDIIQDIDLPNYDLAADTIDCDNNKAIITLTHLDSDNGAVYNWVGPNFSSDLQSPTVSEAGDYNITVTGSNGCEKDSFISVYDDFMVPDLVVADDTLPCDGSPIELFALTTTPNVTYQWVGPNGFDSTTASVFADIPGNYFVEVTGENGCSINKSLKLSDIPIFPKFDISKANDINCYSFTSVITGEDLEDDESFIWTGPSDFISFEDSFTTDQAGMYYIEVTGITGCVERDSIEVKLDTMAPIINIEQDGRLLCDVNEISISGQGSSLGPEFKYTWTATDGEIVFGANSLNPVISGAGNYLLEILDEENGCVDFEEIEIVEEESTLDGLELLIEKQTCNGIVDGHIQILNTYGGEEPYRYAVEGTSFSSIDTFSNLESGEYLLSVKDSFGCIYDTLVNVELSKDVKVDLGEDIEIDLGEIITLNAETNLPPTQIAELRWNPANVINCGDCLDFTFMPDGNMIASIYIEDFDGCVAEDQIIIRVNEDINLYVPNIFTPNQDGRNDLFFVSESKNVEEVVFFNIYDRWGSIVFTDENFIPGQGQKWDGTHLGQSIQEGVYVYVAELQMVNGKTQFIRGNITVLR